MPALAGLNMPSGNESLDPTDPALLDSLKAIGFEVVRIDVQDLSAPDAAWRAEEVLAAGLQPLCIINDGEQLRAMPAGCLYDFGNEPNLNKDNRWPTWRDYRDAAEDAIKTAAELTAATPGCIERLYVGSVSNFNRDSFNYLRLLPLLEWAELFNGTGCAPHRYPVSNRPPQWPHLPSRSRDDELVTLHGITGPLPLALGEVGYNGIEYTEDQVAEYMAWERSYFSAHGFELICGYQTNDGDTTTTDVEQHYGWRRGHSLEWKPVAAAFLGAV